MSYESDDELDGSLINNEGADLSLDDDSSSEEDTSIDDDQSSMNSKNKKQADKNCQARKRIEELLEKKRLKELFDDSDDW